MKIQSKMKSLSSGQHFLKSMGPSRAGYSHANSQNWAKIELVLDFMAVLITCKFDEDPIKIKSLLPGQHFLHNMSLGLLVAVET